MFKLIHQLILFSLVTPDALSWLNQSITVTRWHMYFGDFCFQSMVFGIECHWKNNTTFMLMKRYESFMAYRFICILRLTNKCKSDSQRWTSFVYWLNTCLLRNIHWIRYPSDNKSFMNVLLYQLILLFYWYWRFIFCTMTTLNITDIHRLHF